MKAMPWRLIGAALLLASLGLAGLWFLAPPVGADLMKNSFVKQLAFVVVGVGLMTLAMLPSPMAIRRWAPWIYLAGILALAALLMWAKPVRGARGWFAVGPFTLQPAEFMKLALVLALAKYLSAERNWQSLWGAAGAAAIAAVPAALIVVQPDLGNALVFIPILFAMAYAAGLPRKWLIGGLAALAIAGPIVFYAGMKDYQRARLASFVRPDLQSLQQKHAMGATASGGFMGRGVGETAGAYPFHIPDRHTDFIFSAVGEQLGFVGCSLVLLLFAALLYEMFRVAWTTRDPYGRLVVVGIAAFLTAQLTINVGMTVGMAPVTGLTLPFVSAGGSSLWTCLLAVGVVANIARRKMHELGRVT